MTRFATSAIAGLLLVAALYWSLAELSKPRDRHELYHLRLHPAPVLLPSEVTPLSPLPPKSERRVKPTVHVPIVSGVRLIPELPTDEAPSFPPPSALDLLASTETRDETPPLIRALYDSPCVACETSCGSACLGIQIIQPQQPDLPAGAFVSLMFESSPAKRAGLQVSDIIVELNDHRIDSYDQIPLVVCNMQSGEPFRARVFRNGRQENLNGVVGEMQDLACFP
jgi:hypothetical protein